VNAEATNGQALEERLTTKVLNHLVDERKTRCRNGRNKVREVRDQIPLSPAAAGVSRRQQRPNHARGFGGAQVRA
jgi:hypothetical protein